MKKSGFLLLFLMLCVNLSAQRRSHKQPPALGIQFIFNDFATAEAIRNSSLSTVIRENRFGKLKDMAQGLSLTYSQGLSNHFDFSSMLTGSFLSYPFEDKPPSTSDFLLLEVDACIRGKLLTDRSWVVPFMLVGTGVSKYKGYWGTFMPVGIGIQINFFNEAFLLFSSQYRVGITESVSGHFVHSIGLAGNIGKHE